MKPSGDDRCTQGDYVSLPGPEGYISAAVAKDTGAGSLKCPWKISVQLGQRINISIVDFHPVTDTINCIPLAYIVDVTSKENRTVCKPNERSQQVYVSTGNSVQIQMITASTSLNNQEAFLLHYGGKANKLLLFTMHWLSLGGPSLVLKDDFLISS